ncbi:Hypothetical predicted protein [Mytilus galloprovincialis]|uniref:Uncharacterized protein n=1 Tax=Mytilus galloprovincialis TaxID=29158 RepID=A0A8B6GSR2_MYTGA|nr:Hypothetical predicted protein [Mytilus galloprovincialis]
MTTSQPLLSRTRRPSAAVTELENELKDIKLINVGKKKKDVKFVLTPTKKRLLSRSISASSSTDSFDSSK